jgi:aminopeptidase N
MRFNIVADLRYKVDLVLPKGEYYNGHITIEFTCKVIPEDDLFLDFRGLKVANLKVNGTEVVADFLNHRIQLAASHLVLGPNTVSLFILNKYRNDGVGLHTFIDQQDKLQYLYTQFETDYCHYVFPCFDQPDLKAVWQLSTLTEEDWCVISNEHETFDEEDRTD